MSASKAAAPRERPILFSGPMVRAILEGRKTVTRRQVKADWACRFDEPRGQADVDAGYPFIEFEDGWVSAVKVCPYGQPGERLWLRETSYAWGRWETRYSEKKGRDEWHFVDMTLECGKQYQYPASVVEENGPRQRGGATPQWWKRPAIHMPRVASRILLEVTAVRAERLQDISEEQAIAEGGPVDHPNGTACGWYEQLWESLNGDGSWAANPWVWVVEFKRVTP